MLVHIFMSFALIESNGTDSNFGVLALQFSGELVLIMLPGESTIKTIS